MEFFFKKEFEICYTLSLSYDFDNIVCNYGEHRTQWCDTKYESHKATHHVLSLILF
jgi:hypothetical protein